MIVRNGDQDLRTKQDVRAGADRNNAGENLNKFRVVQGGLRRISPHTGSILTRPGILFIVS